MKHGNRQDDGECSLGNRGGRIGENYKHLSGYDSGNSRMSIGVVRPYVRSCNPDCVSASANNGAPTCVVIASTSSLVLLKTLSIQIYMAFGLCQFNITIFTHMFVSL